MSESTGPFGSGGYNPMPDRAAVQLAARKKRIKTGLWSLGVIGVLTFSMVWNPPTGSIHSFTKASDYKASSDSGCTNSGEGCHGDESSFTDFNEYHPNAKCTVCHEYQGVGCIPCHKPNGHECQSCHDGTLEIAADRNRITDPYPRGHYRETTHTATGTDIKGVVRAAADGEAGAECKACHSRDLYESHQKVPVAEGSEYGDGIGCGECHNDARANGLDQVLANWKNRRCEDCHTADSSAPMHDAEVAGVVKATGPASCGETGEGCHDNKDLHALHGDAPKDCSGAAAEGEPTCHDLTLQSHVPSMTACGTGAGEACHPDYANDDFSHKRDRKKHSVSGLSLAGDTRYGASCADCHMLTNDGMSLIHEHDRPNGTIAGSYPSTCDACHNKSDATVATVKDGWEERSGSAACEACHDSGTMDSRHGSDSVHEGRPLTSAGTADNAACVGAGCHSTLDVRELHAATGCTTPSCHQNSGDINGRNTVSCGGSGSSVACHADVHDGYRAIHVAGRPQAVATYRDSASTVTVRCLDCHSMDLIIEHDRSNSTLSTSIGTICTNCHEATDGTRAVVDGRWAARTTSTACAACHKVSSGVPTLHNAIGGVHVATEFNASGAATPKTCVDSGCHPSTDVRIVHKDKGCTIDGCHQPTGDIRGANVLRCGGTDSKNCHSGTTVASHQSHDAEAANAGCFGCHYADLVLEHSEALRDGSMEGGGQSSCRICHEGPVTADNGDYSALAAVKTAIADGDRRCIACHKSGSTDGATAVASPHRVIAADLQNQPVGAVWSDPAADWNAALNATTGGGHNVSPETVGTDRRTNFPTTSFAVGAWPLQSNLATTTWLRNGLEVTTETASIGTNDYPSAVTTVGIQNIMVACDDCHTLGNTAGPQGAAVKITIDPEYSQTGYANPPSNGFQFDPFNVDPSTVRVGTVYYPSDNPRNADGSIPDPYKPVVCVKCHLVYAHWRPGASSVAVGGASLHATHKSRHDVDPASPGPQTETCVGCHVRIPHAWKRPRLLMRTVQTGGTDPDTAPYVPATTMTLWGVQLRSITSTGLAGADCATGCTTHSHANSSTVLPPTQSYWP